MLSEEMITQGREVEEPLGGSAVRPRPTALFEATCPETNPGPAS